MKQCINKLEVKKAEYLKQIAEERFKYEAKNAGFKKNRGVGRILLKEKLAIFFDLYDVTVKMEERDETVNRCAIKIILEKH